MQDGSTHDDSNSRGLIRWTWTDYFLVLEVALWPDVDIWCPDNLHNINTYLSGPRVDVCSSREVSNSNLYRI